MSWHKPDSVTPKTYTCGYCGKVVGPDKGYANTNKNLPWVIFICSFCNKPTFFDGNDGNKQWPGVSYGAEIGHLPEMLGALYDEARRCMSVSAYTAAVLACRKMLMHIAVEQGAEENKSFMAYVSYLADNNYIPPNGKGWVDHIRQRGNEANHEIVVMDQAIAEELITFIEMLLRFIYEFPARIGE